MGDDSDGGAPAGRFSGQPVIIRANALAQTTPTANPVFPNRMVVFIFIAPRLPKKLPTFRREPLADCCFYAATASVREAQPIFRPPHRANFPRTRFHDSCRVTGTIAVFHRFVPFLCVVRLESR